MQKNKNMEKGKRKQRVNIKGTSPSKTKPKRICDERGEIKLWGVVAMHTHTFVVCGVCIVKLTCWRVCACVFREEKGKERGGGKKVGFFLCVSISNLFWLD